MPRLPCIVASSDPGLGARNESAQGCGPTTHGGGWKLRNLNIPKHRVSSSQQVLLGRDTRLSVHRLVRVYGLSSTQLVENGCPDCDQEKLSNSKGLIFASCPTRKCQLHSVAPGVGPFSKGDELFPVATFKSLPS